MKLALIPPVSRLKDTYDTNIQLALPHMLMNNPEYSKHYQELHEKSDQYTILDNGAAEGEHFDNEDLAGLIRSYAPDEFAVPDILADSDSTVASAFHFLLDHAVDLRHEGCTTKFGFVAQGQDVKEACNAVDSIIDSAVGHHIQVIYIPRLLVARAGKSARLDVAEYIYYRYKNTLEIHLFGASVKWPQEIREATKLHYIRSMDTSLPYVYGLAKYVLNDSSKAEASRPENYFDATFDIAQQAITDANVTTLEAWADGRS